MPDDGPDYYDEGDCPECCGTGEIVGDDDVERTCPECDGSGWRPINFQPFDDDEI